MTPYQIEAERVRFEARMTAKHGPLNFRRDCTGGYEAGWICHEWFGWLSRAEEQYASEAAEADYDEFREANKWERRE